jgi:hypothetical protein
MSGEHEERDICMCVHACACVWADVCVHVCVRMCVRMCVHVCVQVWLGEFQSNSHLLKEVMLQLTKEEMQRDYKTTQVRRDSWTFEGHESSGIWRLGADSEREEYMKFMLYMNFQDYGKIREN